MIDREESKPHPPKRATASVLDITIGISDISDFFSMQTVNQNRPRPLFIQNTIKPTVLTSFPTFPHSPSLSFHRLLFIFHSSFCLSLSLRLPIARSAVGQTSHWDHEVEWARAFPLLLPISIWTHTHTAVSKCSIRMSLLRRAGTERRRNRRH